MKKLKLVLSNDIEFVDGWSDLCSIYASEANDTEFLLCKSLKNKIKITSEKSNCREIVCDEFRNSFRSGTADETKATILMYRATNTKNLKGRFKSSMERGVALINILERKLGWRRTTFFETTHPIGNDHTFYYVKGSRKWIKSPHLFSLFLLLVRAGRATCTSKIKNMDNFFTVIEEGAKGSNKTTGKRDLLLISIRASMWYLIIKETNTIFRENPSNIWLSNYFSEYDGMNNLCRGGSEYKYLNKRVYKLLNKHNLIDKKDGWKTSL